jgi:hypothetical protein
MANVEQRPERLHALDAVRSFALLLGIVLHATMSFLPAPTPIWIIEDSHPSMTLGVLFFVIHVFRMTTFFLIAGFFAHLSFHRRGSWGFIRDRLQRIALPLGVGWPILFAAMTVVVFWAAGFPHGGPLPGPSRWPPVLPKFPLTHLWFLYVLLEFYAALLVLRAGVAWLDQDGRFRDRVDRLVGLMMRSRLAPRFWPCRSGSRFASIQHGSAGSACERRTHPSPPIRKPGSVSALRSALVGCCIARSICSEFWSNAGCSIWCWRPS